MTQDQRETVFPEIGVSEGLSWSWHLDLETLLTALSEPAPWNSARPTASPRPELAVRHSLSRQLADLSPAQVGAALGPASPQRH